MDEAQQNQLKNLLVDFEDLFSKNEGYLGQTELIKYKIDVGDSTPYVRTDKSPTIGERRRS